MTDQHDHNWEEAYAAGYLPTPVDSDVVQVASDLEPASALDLGCGTGQNSLWLGGEGWTVTGIDISKAAIAAARKAAEDSNTNVRFEVADLTKWPGNHHLYELVLSNYALPPAGPGRDNALTVAARSVAIGGTILVSEFDISLSGKGWLKDEDLASTEDIVSYLEGFDVKTRQVRVTTHTHGNDSKDMPVALVVGTRSR